MEVLFQDLPAENEAKPRKERFNTAIPEYIAFNLFSKF
jgi:hypothetical protein